jgi:excisionase family DNA binding protein
MHFSIQPGMRENAASKRQHSAPTVPSDVNADLASSADAASPRAVAGEPNVVAAPVDPQTMTQGNFEPLIDSCQAARLLGNIHVKTLQRYARHGRLPGYQIGGHWYFRASELDYWLRSRINSSCHPCRLHKEEK